MNLQQLKAKYANNTATASAKVTTSVTGAASKTWNATKSATASATSYVKGITPATNRRVNSIASELNAQLNTHDKELFKHQIMIEMIAQKTGVNLPTDEILEMYWEVEQQVSKPEVVAALDDIKASMEKHRAEAALNPEVMEYARQQLDEAPEEEEEVEEEETTPAGSNKEARRKAALARQSQEEPASEEKKAPKQRRFQCASDGCKKKVHEKGDVCQSCEAEVVEEEKETVPATPKKVGRRKLGRQAPITNEEE